MDIDKEVAKAKKSLAKFIDKKAAEAKKEIAKAFEESRKQFEQKKD